MRKAWMVAISRVVIYQLPIRPYHKLMGCASDHDLSGWGAIDPLVEQLPRMAQVVAQAGSLRIERAEDESSVCLNGGDVCQIVARTVESWPVSFLQRHRGKLPGTVVNPSMIAAGEVPC